MAYSFLSALYQGITTGFLELRPCSEPSAFLPFPLDEEQFFAAYRHLEAHPRAKPYFGIAVRGVKGGTAECCSLLTALYLDADFKYAEPDVWKKTLLAHPYSPSALVLTGGGYQAYWFLTEPYSLRTPEDRAKMTRTLERWRQTIPIPSDELTDTPRVFRLPDTWNRKYDPPRRSRVELLSADLRYDLAELAAHANSTAVAHDESVQEAGVVAPAYVLPAALEEGTLEKGRHYTLGRFLRSVKSRYDLTWPEAWALLRAVNRERVKPPIPERELEPYLKRWWNRPSDDTVRASTPYLGDAAAWQDHSL